MSEKDLIETLGVTALGTGGLSSRMSLMSMANDSATGGNSATSITTSLFDKGEVFFLQLWEQAKGIICYIHREGVRIQGEADLVKYLAGALIAAGSITNALAVIVVTIAVKRGLDILCPIPVAS